MLRNTLPCRAIIAAALLAAHTALATSAHADVIHVPDDYPTIQQAIVAAQDGDEIIVAPGTYFESINLLGKAVHLRSSDGPQETIIDASGLETSVVTMTSGEGPETIVEGFTITGGAGTLFNGVRYGGGMYLAGASPAIVNCIFQENMSGRGGALAAVEESTPWVTGCGFTTNSGVSPSAGPDARGGAIYNLNSTLHLTDCSFNNNTVVMKFAVVAAHGGAIYSEDGAVTLAGCAFISNRVDTLWEGDSSGGALYSQNGSLVLSDCLFAGNLITTGWGNGRGGAIFSTAGDVMLIDCTFEDNRSITSGDHLTHASGGALYSLDDAVLLAGCVFTSNSCSAVAEHPFARGGAMYIRDSSVAVIDSIFSDGSVTAVSDSSGAGIASGGAIFSAGTAFLEITGTSFQHNVATASGGSVDGNVASALGGAISGGSITLLESTFEGNAVSAAGPATLSSGGAISTGPQAFQIGASKFCDNLPDHIDGNWTNLGGNQFGVNCPVGDLTGNGAVGVADLLLLLSAWGACDDCTPGDSTACPADLDGDCAVGVADLLILLQNWTG